LVGYLSALDRDDSVESAGGVVEEGDGDCEGGGGEPTPLSPRVNVEYVCLARENRLLPVKEHTKLTLSHE
jgi:hypothetical protein